MWRDHALPRLHARGLGADRAAETLRLTGIGESAVVDLIGEAILRTEQPQVATYARVDAVDLRVSAVGEPGRPARAIVDETDRPPDAARRALRLRAGRRGLARRAHSPPRLPPDPRSSRSGRPASSRRSSGPHRGFRPPKSSGMDRRSTGPTSPASRRRRGPGMASRWDSRSTPALPTTTCASRSRSMSTASSPGASTPPSGLARSVGDGPRTSPARRSGHDSGTSRRPSDEDRPDQGQIPTPVAREAHRDPSEPFIGLLTPMIVPL